MRVILIKNLCGYGPGESVGLSHKRGMDAIDNGDAKPATDEDEALYNEMKANAKRTSKKEEPTEEKVETKSIEEPVAHKQVLTPKKKKKRRF